MVLATGKVGTRSVTSPSEGGSTASTKVPRAELLGPWRRGGGVDSDRPMLRIGAMVASRQEIYFIAIRMQVGSVRRELGLIGLGDGARQIVVEALDRIEAQVRQWGVERLVVEAQLQELLASLMKLPAHLRTLKEAGQEGEITLERFEEWGLIAPRKREDGSGLVN